MSEPAALEKANSLMRFVRDQGVPISEFRLALTKGEAYELLDYMAKGGLGFASRHDLLIADINEAKLAGNPFSIFEHFSILGFSVTPATELH